MRWCLLGLLETFEQCWISWRVVWPCVIAVLYWAVCLSCQTYCSFLAAAAGSFTPSINLQALCLYDLLLGRCIDFFFFFFPASTLCYPSDQRQKNKWQMPQRVVRSWQKCHCFQEWIIWHLFVFIYLICRSWQDKGHCIQGIAIISGSAHTTFISNKKI